MESRWERLERYARWKQRRFRLDALPADLLAHVCSFLPVESVSRLLHAMLGKPVRVECRHDALLIPCTLRATWLREQAYEGLRHALRSLSENACFFARDCARVVILSDWSSFSKVAAAPLAEYAWSARRTVDLVVREERVRAVVDSCIERQICGVRLTLHAVVGAWVHPHPLVATQCLVYPAFLL